MKRDWLTTSGQFHIRDLAHHFGIFQHLFGDAYFVPRVPLDIQFQLADDVMAPVYYGNTIRPSDAQNAPHVRFDSTVNIPGNEAGDSLWTLVLTNPDGHLEQAGKEYVHWFMWVFRLVKAAFSVCVIGFFSMLQFQYPRWLRCAEG